jgi:hypothetical protein
MGGDDSYVPPGSALEKEMIAKGEHPSEPPEEQGEAVSLPA